MPDVDVVVVGMGPGGEDAAERLAAAGLSVGGVDDRLVGGECPYWGCIPSKMMIRAANLLAEARRIPGMAGAAAVQPDWAPVARRIRVEATDDWDDKVAVRAGGRRPGRHPVLDQPGGHRGHRGAPVPDGHGRRAGRDRAGQDVFARDGIDVRTGAEAEAVRHDGTRFTVALSGGAQVTADALLVATGRHTDLAGLGVGLLGVDETGPTIPVDDHLRVAPGCGPSATSPGTARSPTCPCTRPASWSRTSSASRWRRPSTTRYPGSRSPIRRSARSG
jgi:hypothetical protein